MLSRSSLALLLTFAAAAGCSQSEPDTVQPIDEAAVVQSVVEPVGLPEQTASDGPSITYRPFLLSGRTIGLATPFGIEVTESRYGFPVAEMDERFPVGTPENVALRALKLMRAGDTEGLIELASDDSHAGNVKVYASLGQMIEEEPTATFRFNLLDHTCVCFATGNERVPGITIPIQRRGENFEFFLTDQSSSLQQFLFQIVDGPIRFPDAAAAIPESRIQTRFQYQHPKASEPISVVVTNFAGVGDDDELILPPDFAGHKQPLHDILGFQRAFWETFASEGLEAAGEKVHSDLKLFFVKRAERKVAAGHHPYDSFQNENERPEYSLKVKWIAWTENVWTLGVDVTKRATPEAVPKVWAIVERYVLDPEIGETRYWAVTGDNLTSVLTDDAVQGQIGDYIQSLR